MSHSSFTHSSLLDALLARGWCLQHQNKLQKLSVFVCDSVQVQYVTGVRCVERRERNLKKNFTSFPEWMGDSVQIETARRRVDR